MGGDLTIHGWTGGAPGPQLIITGMASMDFLSHVKFADYEGGATLLPDGLLAPVPEPQVYAAVFGIGLVIFAAARGQRTRKR